MGDNDNCWPAPLEVGFSKLLRHSDCFKAVLAFMKMFHEFILFPEISLPLVLLCRFFELVHSFMAEMGEEGNWCSSPVELEVNWGEGTVNQALVFLGRISQ